MSEHRLNQIEKNKADAHGSQYVHEIHFQSGFIMNGYSEMYWWDANGNRKPWPFATKPGYNFNNYFLRMTCGKSPYYPGHKRGINKIVFYENNESGDMVAKLFRDSIQWSNRLLVDKQWTEIRDRIDLIVTKFLANLPPNPNPADLEKVKKTYSFSRKGFQVDFDSSDMSRQWNSIKSLQNFCKMIIAAGHSEEEVFHYERKYTEKYFNQ